MTEMEQLLAWLIRVNLPYSTWDVDGHKVFCIGRPWPNISLASAEQKNQVVDHAGNDELVDGYQGFFHLFVFDEHEDLIESSTWE